MPLSAEVSNWTGWPLPYTMGYNEEPTPKELLSLVPPMVKAPASTQQERERGFLTWWPDYTETFFGEVPPAQRGAPWCEMPLGEYEPLLVGLWGLSAGDVTLSVSSPIPCTVRAVHWISRYVPGGGHGLDAPPGGREVSAPRWLPLQRTVTLRPKHNEVFWLTFQGTVPGVHTITLTLTNRKTGATQRETVQVKVHDWRLPPADIPFGLYAPVTDNYFPAEQVTPTQTEKYWRDMAEHGQTSICYYDEWANLEERLTADGTFYPNARSIAELDKMLEVGLLHPDIPLILMNGSATRVAEQVKQLFAEHKWPEPIVYSVDEPTFNAQEYRSFLADQPGRQFVRIASSMHNELMGMCYGPLVDVWIVARGLVGESAGGGGTELRQWAVLNKAEVWTYDCWQHPLPCAVDSQYYAGLYTWALGLGGNFVWAYRHMGTPAWNTTAQNAGIAWSQVAWSPTGLIPGTNWEGRREGVEDYRLLCALEDKADEHPDVAAWLARVRTKVDWFAARNSPKLSADWEKGLWPQTGGFAPGEMRQVRREALKLLDEFGG